MTDAAKQWLTLTGFDPVYGARPLRRLVQKEIGDRLARAILSGEVRDGDAGDGRPRGRRPGSADRRRRRSRLLGVTDSPLPEVDPGRLDKARWLLEHALRTYHRNETTGQEHLPDGGALIVGNHSGGLIAMDVPIIAVAYWERFGVERPFHVLAHNLLMMGPVGAFLRSFGFVLATRENALTTLRSGGATVVFPGGDYEAYRPTTDRNTIDFKGRTGYVRTAIEAGVPIVPVVSIGGQETQVVLSRGERIARLMPWTKRFTSYVPVTLGFPWGLAVGFPFQLPLPSKIVTRFLPPVDPAAFATVEEVDAQVRARMQAALDEMAAARRFPVIG